MPFFSAFAGLVGAIIYFPLVVHFPIKLYKKVYAVSKAQSIALSTIYWVFLGICLASIVGAVESLISSWSSFQVNTRVENVLLTVYVAERSSRLERLRTCLCVLQFFQ